MHRKSTCCLRECVWTRGKAFPAHEECGADPNARRSRRLKYLLLAPSFPPCVGPARLCRLQALLCPPQAESVRHIDKGGVLRSEFPTAVDCRARIVSQYTTHCGIYLYLDEIGQKSRCNLPSKPRFLTSPDFLILQLCRQPSDRLSRTQHVRVRSNRVRGRYDEQQVPTVIVDPPAACIERSDTQIR